MRFQKQLPTMQRHKSNLEKKTLQVLLTEKKTTFN